MGMDNRKYRKIEKKITALQNEMRELGPVMRGSVTQMGKRHKQPYFSVGIRKKTKVIYLGNKRAVKARAYVANYRQLLQIAEDMTILNMELLKMESPE
jgi:hypothetical protein